MITSLTNVISILIILVHFGIFIITSLSSDIWIFLLEIFSQEIILLFYDADLKYMYLTGD